MVCRRPLKIDIINLLHKLLSTRLKLNPTCFPHFHDQEHAAIVS